MLTWFFDPEWKGNNLHLAENDTKMNNDCGSWRTCCGTVPVPDSGITTFALKILIINYSVELGIMKKEGDKDSYLGKHSHGFAYQVSGNESSNDGTWHNGNHNSAGSYGS